MKRDEILPAIQVMTPEQTLVSFAYFVEPDDKFEPEVRNDAMLLRARGYMKLDNRDLLALC